MQIFVSWSGNRSKALAQSLVGWLPRVLPLVHPWVSEKIPKGSEWRTTLMTEMIKSTASVVCLTPENLRSPWLNFEAGAMAAHTAPAYHLLPVLFGSDALTGPLSGLQVTRTSQEEMRLFVHTINNLCEPKCPESWVDNQFSLFWKELDRELEGIKQMLRDGTWEDYDEAIKNIQEHLTKLVKTEEVSAITFYVRDYAAPRESVDYYIEAAPGLRDPAPMYGPVVFDDFRKGGVEPETFREDMKRELRLASSGKIAGRAPSFVGREQIRACAVFRNFETDGGVKAMLNLNWRNAQTFDETQKEHWRKVAAGVFGLLPERPFISLERSRLLTRELRARRHLDTSVLDASTFKEKCSRIRETLGQFFAPGEDEIAVQIMPFDKNSASRSSKLPASGKRRTKDKIQADWQWVRATTKPLFLHSPDRFSQIIVPMRNPPALNECKGIIVMEEAAAGRLKSGMVRPLCSLADTFGGLL